MDCPSCSASLALWLSGSDRRTRKGFYCTKCREHYPVEQKEEVLAEASYAPSAEKEIVVPEGKFLKETQKPISLWRKVVQFFRGFFS